MKYCSVSLIERKKERKKASKKKQIFCLEKIDSEKPNKILCGSHRQTLCGQGKTS
jgi:hypothetical protein